MKGTSPKLLMLGEGGEYHHSIQRELGFKGLVVDQAPAKMSSLHATVSDEYFLVLLDIASEDSELLASYLNSDDSHVSVPVVVLVTGHHTYNVQDFLDLGCVDSVTVPIDRIAFRSKIDVYLSLFQKKCDINTLAAEKHALMDAACEGIVGFDQHFSITYANAIAAKLLGEPAEQLFGEPLLPFISDQSASSWEHSNIAQALNRKAKYRQEHCVFLQRSGATFPVSFTVSPVIDSFHVIGGILAFSDLSEHDKMLHELSMMAQNDALTGLYNRGMFATELANAIKSADRYGYDVALHFIDIDHFKDVNDTLGHDAGDAVIVEAAQRLQRCTRDTDVVGRLGGDEFGIIQRLDKSGELGAAWMAKRVVEAFQPVVEFHEKEIGIGCSLGVALYPEHADTAKGLLKAADTAMYKSKNLGRNQYHFYNAAMQEQVVRHISLVSGLKKAIERGEMSVVYQPQIDLSTKSVCGIEALIRWESKELGVVSPAVFIPIAEQCGFIQTLGKWVLDQACRAVSQWRFSGKYSASTIPISVNVSVNQIARGNLSQCVKTVLHQTGLSPDLLRLEITETVLMKNPDASVKEIENINALGVDVAIDDFGTGYCSLSYLGVLPASCLKIDRSFIMDIHNKPAHQKIVLSIVRLAESLGHTVVAEGVESVEELKYLASVGCHVIQGYYFCKPVPEEELMAFVNNLHERFPLKSLSEWLQIANRRSYRTLG